MTDATGTYRIADVTLGPSWSSPGSSGREPQQISVIVPADGVAEGNFTLNAAPFHLSDVVVTASREEEKRVAIPAAIGVVDGATLRALDPNHPADALNRVAGVYVRVTNGEGHMTAIRQPISTDPVYLYLEDGIPTRSTGFFNHNALYEVNLPQADRIEVLKGPATALYGSDAIGGVINVSTRAPSAARWLDLGRRRLVQLGPPAGDRKQYPAGKGRARRPKPHRHRRLARFDVVRPAERHTPVGSAPGRDVAAEVGRDLLADRSAVRKRRPSR